MSLSDPRRRYASQAAMHSHSATRLSPIDAQIILLCFFLGSIGLASVNPILTFAGFALVPVLWKLLWRPGEPAVLFFCAMFQWAQAFMQVVSADIEGRTLEEIFGGPELGWAAWASLGSVFFLALGMWSTTHIFTGLTIPTETIRHQSAQLDVNKLAYLYVILQVVAFGFALASERIGALRQPLLAFASIKWVPVVLLAWVTMQNRRNPTMLMLVVMCEVVFGFTGYFSTFKNVIFIVLLVGLGVVVDRGRFRAGPVLVSILVMVPLIGFWQTVKTDYRKFLNQGTGQQVTLIPVQDRINFLIKAIEKLEAQGMVKGLATATERLGYLEYFAITLSVVPNRVPHENGNLWMGALTHTLMPRVLFPGKATLNESQRTSKYTMMSLAGEGQGTAISLGYPAESYIDFGLGGMFFPIFFLGLLFGWTYHWFSSRRPYFPFGNALATSILLFSAHQLEMSNIKIVGGVVVGIIAFAITQKQFVPWMWKFCLIRSNSEPVAR